MRAAMRCALACLLALVCACADPAEPIKPGGVYWLVSRNGELVPVTANLHDANRAITVNEITAGSIDLGDDAYHITWLTVDGRTNCCPFSGGVSFGEGYVTFRGDSVFIPFSYGVTGKGAFSGPASGRDLRVDFGEGWGLLLFRREQ